MLSLFITSNTSGISRETVVVVGVSAMVMSGPPSQVVIARVLCGIHRAKIHMVISPNKNLKGFITLQFKMLIIKTKYKGKKCLFNYQKD